MQATKLQIPAARIIPGHRRSLGPRARLGVVQKRYMQSNAQTDRVSCLVRVSGSRIHKFTNDFTGHYHPTPVLDWHETGSRTPPLNFLVVLPPVAASQVCCYQVGGAVLSDLDELALLLSFLYRVGLYPVIVLVLG
jgi:hypothetical protein